MQSEGWIRAVPGAGYFSIAVLYVTIGLLAGLVALGLRGDTPDVRAALRALWRQPFGPLILFVVALGSLCLVFWRLLQAIVDLEGKGRSLLGIVQRGRYLFGALIYLGLPIVIFKMFAGTPSPPGEQIAREVVSDIIRLPFGWTLVVAAGLCFLGTGAYCIFRSFRPNFAGWFFCEEMTEAQKKVCFTLGRLGYAARGMILIPMGYLIINAGWTLNPYQISGQAGAMHLIARQPFGPLLLGMIAVGLISFGIFSLIALRYGKVPVERVRQVMRASELIA